VDSIVYDTVLEETGSSELYEKWIGRVRTVESAALVISALAGGVLAEYTSARFTYFATVPLVGLAIIGFLRFDEPRLHQAVERVTLRSHVALTFRTAVSSCRPCSTDRTGRHWSPPLGVSGGLLTSKLRLNAGRCWRC
jgi:hypothetical protein